MVKADYLVVGGNLLIKHAKVQASIFCKGQIQIIGGSVVKGQIVYARGPIEIKTGGEMSPLPRVTSLITGLDLITIDQPFKKTEIKTSKLFPVGSTQSTLVKVSWETR